LEVANASPLHGENLFTLILNMMKTIRLVILALSLGITGLLHAQVSVNINLGSPPMWGPVGYADARYYYLPDVYAYYDIHSSLFIYQSGGIWIRRAYLPSRYSNYDLYKGYKVVMTDYHGNKPYIHYKEYKSKYAKGYHGPAQRSIGTRPEKGNSGTQVHDKDKSNHKSGNGNGNQENHGNGHGKDKK
jgi:hypothetical protein